MLFAVVPLAVDKHTVNDVGNVGELSGAWAGAEKVLELP